MTPKNTIIEIGSILSQRTKEGLVELTLNGEKTQMDLPKAREVLGMLSGAIEAAVSDQLLFAFLTQKVGLSEGSAAAALLGLDPALRRLVFEFAAQHRSGRA
jgi:hypothetical protein